MKEVMRTNKIIHQDDSLKKLPHVLVPNTTVGFHEGVIRINNLGFKGKDISKDKRDSFRIVTLGESTTFGQNVFKDSQPWSEVLQSLIEKRLTCNCKIEVINFGVNAYVLKDGIELLTRNMQWVEPDMVLSYFGWNGVNDLGVDSKFFLDSIPIEPPKLKNVSRPEFVFYKIQSKINSIMNSIFNIFVVERLFHFFRDPLETERDILKQIRKGTYYKNYQKLVEIGNKYNFLLFLISFNTAATVDSPAEALHFYQIPFPGVRSTVQLMGYHNKMIKELSVSHKNVYYLDSSSNILGKYNDDIFLDIVHFTPKGDRRMANNVFKGILSFLLNHPRLKCTLKNSQ